MNMKYLRFTKLAIYLTIGVLLGVFHVFIIDNLSFTLPIIIVLYGIESISVSIYYHRKDFYIKHRFYWGIVEMLLGLIVLIYVVDFEVTCIVWAIWAILREAEEIREAVETIDCLITSIIVIVAGIVNIVFSVLLIIFPTEHHATEHLYLLIVELAVASIVPIIDFYFYKVDHKNSI